MAIALSSCALGTSATLGAATATAWLDAVAQIPAKALYLGSDAVGRQLVLESELCFLRRAELPVLALDAALGAVHPGKTGLMPQAARARAASLDRDEAETAVSVVRAALGLAEALGARYVSLSLGGPPRLERLWKKLRGRFLRGVLLYDEESAREFMAVRASLAKKYLDVALRSLDQIVEEAVRRGTTVLVRNPRRPAELPTGIELSVIRAEFAGAPLGPLLDLPAAHLLSMMRCVALRESVLSFGDGPLSFLADACGAVAGLAPGQGEVELAAVVRALSKDAARAFLPWPGLSPFEIGVGYRAVANL